MMRLTQRRKGAKAQRGKRKSIDSSFLPQLSSPVRLSSRGPFDGSLDVAEVWTPKDKKSWVGGVRLRLCAFALKGGRDFSLRLQIWVLVCVAVSGVSSPRSAERRRVFRRRAACRAAGVSADGAAHREADTSLKSSSPANTVGISYPMSFWIASRENTKFSQARVIALPRAPTLAVRPIRWT